MADTHVYDDEGSRRYADDSRSGAYAAEHTLGWLMALASLALGAIGLLVAFGILGGSEAGVNIDEAAGAGAAGASDWMQGALWLLPAIAIALLSRALHSADHHERLGAYADERNDSMFSMEHAGAYLAALLTIAAAALAPLVGFDVFDNGNVAEDGLIWGLTSLVPAVLTNTLHAVRHHQHAVITTTVERRTDVPTGRMARGPR
jgi:hypothetical protein